MTNGSKCPNAIISSFALLRNLSWASGVRGAGAGRSICTGNDVWMGSPPVALVLVRSAPGGKSCFLKDSGLSFNFLCLGPIMIFLSDGFSASITSARTEVHVVSVSRARGFIVIRSSGASILT